MAAAKSRPPRRDELQAFDSWGLVPAMDAPDRLGKYEIRGMIGRGANGTVFDGWDPVIARRVAIKTIQLPRDPDPETGEEVARFRREAQAAGRLTHPNIVGIYDYGETGDLAYIVMESVDGPSLKSVIDRREALPPPRIAAIMEDVLAGLQFSHERGVVHRDIKPANVLMTPEGRAKIADFGIARLEASGMTQTGTMLGTPAYMSPEQFMGQPADARTDVYAAGVLLYVLLTGERPFEGGPTAIMHRVLSAEPLPPSQLAVTSPLALDAVVRRAMAKRPDDRFESAAAFAAAIREALAAPRTATAAAAAPAFADAEQTMIAPPAAAASSSPADIAPPRSVGETPPSIAAPRRGRVPVILGAVVVVGGIAVAGWLLTGRSVPPPPPPAPAPLAAAPSQAAVSPEAKPTPPPPPVPAAPTEQASRQEPSGATPAAPAASLPAAPVLPTAKPQTTPAPEPVSPKTVVPDIATPVAPTPAPPVVATAPALPPAPAVTPLQSVASLLAASPCTIASVAAEPDGTMRIEGVASGDAARMLREVTEKVLGAVPIEWRVQAVNPVLCATIDVLRPVAVQGGVAARGFTLALDGGKTTLRDGERILPRITMPDFAGELRVDYIGHDGSLMHLWPTVAAPAQGVAAQPVRRLRAAERLALGDHGPGRPDWEVAPPFGVDLMIAVAATAPLLPQTPNGNLEASADAYLSMLADAIARVRQEGGQVIASVLPVNTLPK